ECRANRSRVVWRWQHLRLRGQHEAGQRIRDVLHRRPQLVGGFGSASGGHGSALCGCAHLGRCGQSGQWPNDHDDRGQARGLCRGRAFFERHGRQGLQAGRQRGRGQQGQDHQPAAGGRAHCRCGRSHGPGPARGRGPGRVV
ncbi:3-hydroxyisobutyrate dehydrogenase-like protein, partial [Daphnia magna]